MSSRYIIRPDALEKMVELPEMSEYSSFFLLTDKNVRHHCLPVLQALFPIEDENIITINPGEKSKNIVTCEYIWEKLLEKNADRKSLLINFGGGVVGDIGGFCASTFKRGIDFFNIPTSLIGMVDAAVGGKTGVNFIGLKNQIGTFAFPKWIIVTNLFLKTLPFYHIKSGWAEIAKHALIREEKLWHEIQERMQNAFFTDLSIIARCVSIKKKIINTDPFERGERKLLNFGHTVGHAFEAFSQHKPQKLLHGYAVAHGMLVESMLSLHKTNLPISDYEEIRNFILAEFGRFYYKQEEIPQIIELMTADKKNRAGMINFTLLDRIGNASFDHYISYEEVEAVLTDYLNL